MRKLVELDHVVFFPRNNSIQSTNTFYIKVGPWNVTPNSKHFQYLNKEVTGFKILGI